MKKKTSKSVLALLIAAAALIGAGGIGTARAQLNVQSQYYNAWFYLNHLQVHLLENGNDVCGGRNNLDGDSKITGRLLQYLGFESKEKLGSIEPGRAYKEEIAASNGSDIPIFLRLTVRKYWIDEKTGEKVTNMSPKRIKLTYGNKAYNSGAWQINPAESSAESETYYYNTTLAAGASTTPLFDQLMIDPKIAGIEEYTTRYDGSKTIYTYKYHYDGYAFIIEADVQALQTHNANDAVRSQWGVNNVTAEFVSNEVDGKEAGMGTLTVG